LLFAPYACAYVDLNCYQYLLRIFLIGKVLRKSNNDSLLLFYEEQCELFCKKGIFSFGILAQLGSSIAFSIIIPAFAFVRFMQGNSEKWQILSALIAWGIGLIILIYFYISFIFKKKLLKENSNINSVVDRFLSKYEVIKMNSKSYRLDN